MTHNKRTLILVESCRVLRMGIEQLLRSYVDVIHAQPRYIPDQALPGGDLLLLSDSDYEATTMPTTVKHLSQQYPLILLSDRLQIPYIQSVMQNGARGIIYRHDDLELALSSAVETVSLGLVYQSPAVADVWIMGQHLSGQLLNADDYKVLQAMAAGLDVVAMASELAFSVRKIYRIRARLRELLEVSTNEGVISEAYIQGLLQ